jgi:hypothetical protein
MRTCIAFRGRLLTAPAVAACISTSGTAKVSGADRPAQSWVSTFEAKAASSSHGSALAFHASMMHRSLRFPIGCKLQSGRHGRHIDQHAGLLRRAQSKR